MGCLLLRAALCPLLSWTKLDFTAGITIRYNKLCIAAVYSQIE